MSEEDKVEDGSIEITLEDDGDEKGEVEVEVAAKPEPEPERRPSRDDQDLEEHSDKVKKRIDKLTFKIREAERRERAALDFARGLKGELDNYKQKATILDQTLVQEFDNRIRSQERLAKDRLKQAIDMGDSDAQIEAQSLLANVAVENERLRVTRLRREHEDVAERQRYEREARAPQEAPRQLQPDPKAQGWAEKNEWFGADRAMTATAYAIHEDLVSREGYDPTSDEYYEELDHRMRQDFPHKFKKPESVERPQSPVASARTTVKPSQRKISLTPSQVRIAKALNVSLEEYAKHARKQMLGQ